MSLRVKWSWSEDKPCISCRDSKFSSFTCFKFRVTSIAHAVCHDALDDSACSYLFNWASLFHPYRPRPFASPTPAITERSWKIESRSAGSPILHIAMSNLFSEGRDNENAPIPPGVHQHIRSVRMSTDVHGLSDLHIFPSLPYILLQFFVATA
jgi:hypothetical protein